MEWSHFAHCWSFLRKIERKNKTKKCPSAQPSRLSFCLFNKLHFVYIYIYIWQFLDCPCLRLHTLGRTRSEVPSEHPFFGMRFYEFLPHTGSFPARLLYWFRPRSCNCITYASHRCNCRVQRGIDSVRNPTDLYFTAYRFRPTRFSGVLSIFLITPPYLQRGHTGLQV